MDVNTLAIIIAFSQVTAAAGIFLSLFIACAAIDRTQIAARKAQTAAFLHENRFDRRYLEGLHTLRAIHLSGKSFRSYIFPLKELLPKENEERQQLVYCLNFYERLAVGIQHGIYHEQMIKQVFYSSITNNFTIAEPFINAIREKEHRRTYYQEYEYLVKRWRKAPLKTRFS